VRGVKGDACPLREAEDDAGADDMTNAPCAICNHPIVGGSDRIILASDASISGIAHMVCWTSVRGEARPLDDPWKREAVDDCWKEPGCPCRQCRMEEDMLWTLRRAGKIGPGSPMRREAEQRKREVRATSGNRFLKPATRRAGMFVGGVRPPRRNQ